jgi:hypothetical protein
LGYGSNDITGDGAAFALGDQGSGSYETNDRALGGFISTDYEAHSQSAARTSSTGADLWGAYGGSQASTKGGQSIEFQMNFTDATMASLRKGDHKTNQVDVHYDDRNNRMGTTAVGNTGYQAGSELTALMAAGSNLTKKELAGSKADQTALDEYNKWRAEINATQLVSAKSGAVVSKAQVEKHNIATYNNQGLANTGNIIVGQLSNSSALNSALFAEQKTFEEKWRHGGVYQGYTLPAHGTFDQAAVDYYNAMAPIALKGVNVASIKVVWNGHTTSASHVTFDFDHYGLFGRATTGLTMTAGSNVTERGDDFTSGGDGASARGALRQGIIDANSMSSQRKTNADLKRSGLKWNAKQQKYVREGDKPLDNVLSHIQQQGVAQYQSALAREAWYVDTDGTDEAGTSAPMNDNGRDATTSAGMIRQVELDAKMNLLRHLWDVYTARTPTAIDSQATDMALRSGASPSSSPFLASMSAVDVSLS